MLIVIPLEHVFVQAGMFPLSAKYFKIFFTFLIAIIYYKELNTKKTFCKTSDIPQGHRAFQVKRWPPSVQKNIYIFYILYWKTFWWCEKKSERKFKNNYFMWLYFCFIVFEIHQRKYYLVFKGSFSVSFIGLYTYIFHDDNFTKSHICTSKWCTSYFSKDIWVIKTLW